MILLKIQKLSSPLKFYVDHFLWQKDFFIENNDEITSVYKYLMKFWDKVRWRSMYILLMIQEFIVE